MRFEILESKMAYIASGPREFFLKKVFVRAEDCVEEITCLLYTLSVVGI